MRYARQEILPEIGTNGQKRLSESTVTIVGVGALGTVSAALLTRAGIGKIILIDRDIVDESNLQRQALFTEADVGKAKAIQAKEQLERINSDVSIEAYPEDLTDKNIATLVHGDLIMDGTDNMETRFLLNDFAKKKHIPWVYGAAVQDRGSVMSITPSSPCLSCVFKGRKSLETCETAGVLNTIIYFIASLQVTKAIKILLNNSMIIYSRKELQIREWLNCHGN